MISVADAAKVRNFLRYKDRTELVSIYAKCSIKDVENCTKQTARVRMFLRVVDACQIVLFLEQK